MSGKAKCPEPVGLQSHSKVSQVQALKGATTVSDLLNSALGSVPKVLWEGQGADVSKV